MTLGDSATTLGAVVVGSALTLIGSRLEGRRAASNQREDLIREAIAGLVVAALAVPFVQQLLASPAMVRHLRWRRNALDGYLHSTDAKLERLLAAKTTVDLVVDDERLSARADELLEAVLAAGAETGHVLNQKAASESLQKARLAFLAEGRRVLSGLS